VEGAAAAVVKPNTSRATKIGGQQPAFGRASSRRDFEHLRDVIACVGAGAEL
jgi:hypothetical protein